MAQSAVEAGALCMAFNFLPTYEMDGSPSYRRVFHPVIWVLALDALFLDKEEVSMVAGKRGYQSEVKEIGAPGGGPGGGDSSSSDSSRDGRARSGLIVSLRRPDEEGRFTM